MKQRTDKPCAGRASVVCALTILILLAGCRYSIRDEAEAVALTASREAVADCEKVGFVTLPVVDSEFRERQMELKFAAVRAGGNVMLVDSFATATEGTVYNCASIDRTKVAS